MNAVAAPLNHPAPRAVPWQALAVPHSVIPSLGRGISGADALQIPHRCAARNDGRRTRA